MESTTRSFRRCLDNIHEICVGSYFDSEGVKQVCACECHREGK